jgi:hypothetical protein
MLFLFFVTRSILLLQLSLYMDWAVANILIIIPDSGGVFCAHHWN